MVGSFVDKFLLFQIFLPSMSLMLRIWNATPQRSYLLKAHLNWRAANQVEILPKSLTYQEFAVWWRRLNSHSSLLWLRFPVRSAVTELLPIIFPFPAPFVCPLRISSPAEVGRIHSRGTNIGKVNRGKRLKLKCKSWGLGDGLVSKEFATQAWVPECSSQQPG